MQGGSPLYTAVGKNNLGEVLRHAIGRDSIEWDLHAAVYTHAWNVIFVITNAKSTANRRRTDGYRSFTMMKFVNG